MWCQKKFFPYVANTIKQINIVIKSLIPEINIEIYNAFDKLLKEGKDGVQFEIMPCVERTGFRFCMNPQE